MKEHKKHPFNMGIKQFKRELDKFGYSKAEKNKAVRVYKERVTLRLLELKKQLEEGSQNIKEVIDNGQEL